MNKKIALMISFFVIVLIIFYFIFLNKTKNSDHLEIIKRGNIVNSVYGIGTLTAEKSFSIKSGVTSTLHRLYVKEGDNVEKGVLLLDLEGIGEYKAPFSGTIVSIPFKEGETVYAQSSVLVLVDSKNTYLLVSLEQQGALNLKPNLLVKISFDGLRDQVFDGKVESIFSNGTEFLAHILIDKIPKTILPGMTADVAIIIEEKKDVLLIPVAALELKKLIIKRNGKKMIVPVTLGFVDGDYAEVLQGDVNEGDEVILQKRDLK